jgi:molybdopterin/thiamine biosynthesis adenylyltransferase
MGRATAACIPSRHRRGWFPSCAEGGVLGILPGLVGVMQATEVIKLILGIGDPLIGRLLLIDALGMKFRELKLRKNPDARCAARIRRSPS